MATKDKDNKYTICGYLLVPPERIASVLAALPHHIALTRAESGCLVFTVTKNPDQAGRFDVYEEFSDRAAFDAHQIRTANSDWALVSEGLQRHYKIV
ncbi:MAG: antibiotic biosynthesis monooxygenase [Rhodobacteraceae bacterium]|nr:antibiotic biosynthesis monooxygenase [Paracoccaceae bacterium]